MLKRIICFVLTLALAVGAGVSTYLVTERCAIYDDYVYYKRKEGTDIFKDLGITVSEYYTRLPKDFDPVKAATDMELSTDVMELLATAGYAPINGDNRVMLRATYLGADHGFEIRTAFNFRINKIYSYEGKFDPTEGDTIRLYADADRLRYYTDTEFILNYYGVHFEKGEEYLLFLNSSMRGRSISFVGNTLAVCKLSGEYPSIKMLPGPVECDATYFGAKTKYVTDDEFIDLFIAFAQEYYETEALIKAKVRP